MTARRWRYLPPNAVTSASIVIATLAVQSAVEGRPVNAAWLGIICMITDKLDGLLAAALRASSEFGVQLDSLADLVAFGVVPSATYFAYFRARPELGWADGAGRVALVALCAFHVVAVALRLARFNVQAAAGPKRCYFGVPSTMTSGALLALLLFAVAYAGPAAAAPEAIAGRRWLGALDTGALLRVAPAAFVLGAVGMLCSLRVPKLGRTNSRVLDVLMLTGLAIGIAAIVLRRAPEYLVAGTVVYLVTCVIYHLRTAAG